MDRGVVFGAWPVVAGQGGIGVTVVSKMGMALAVRQSYVPSRKVVAAVFRYFLSVLSRGASSHASRLVPAQKLTIAVRLWQSVTFSMLGSEIQAMGLQFYHFAISMAGGGGESGSVGEGALIATPAAAR